MNFADLLIVIVLIFFIFRGFLKGFVISIIRTFSLIISLVVAKLFHVRLANFIFSTFPGVRNAVYDGVKDFVVSSLPKGGAGGIDFWELLNKISPDIAGSIPKIPDLNFNVDSSIYGSAQMNLAIDTLTSHISTFVINCISFIILFALISIGIEIVIMVVKVFRKLPVIGTFDSFLGALLGMVQGWLVLSAVFFVVTNMNHAGMMKDFALQIENSMLASYLMSFSFIGGMVKGMMEITAWAF